jgi:hypothetical protein
MRRHWTRPRPTDRYGHTHVWTPPAKESTFPASLESLEKKASETAASVKAAAEDRAQLKQRIDHAQVQVNLAHKDAQDKTEAVACRAQSKWAQLKAAECVAACVIWPAANSMRDDVNTMTSGAHPP